MYRILIFLLLLVLATSLLYAQGEVLHGASFSAGSSYSPLDRFRVDSAGNVYVPYDISMGRWTTWTAVSSNQLGAYWTSPFIYGTYPFDTQFLVSGSSGGTTYIANTRTIGQVTSWSITSAIFPVSSYGNNALWWQYDGAFYCGSMGSVWRASNIGNFTTNVFTANVVDATLPTTPVGHLFSDGSILLCIVGNNLYSSVSGGANWSKVTTLPFSPFAEYSKPVVKWQGNYIFTMQENDIIVYHTGYIKTIQTPFTTTALASDGKGHLYLFGGTYPSIGWIGSYDGKNVVTLATCERYLTVGYYSNGKAYGAWDEGIVSSGTTFLFSWDGSRLTREIRGSDLDSNWNTNARVRTFFNYHAINCAVAGGGIGGQGVLYAKTNSLQNILSMDKESNSDGNAFPDYEQLNIQGKLQPTDLDTTNYLWKLQTMQITNQLSIGSTPVNLPSFTISTVSTFANAVFLALNSTQFNLSGDPRYQDLTLNCSTGGVSILPMLSNSSSKLFIVYIGSTAPYYRNVQVINTNSNGNNYPFGTGIGSGGQLAGIDYWNIASSNWVYSTVSFTPTANGYYSSGSQKTTSWGLLPNWGTYVLSSANPQPLYWTRFMIQDIDLGLGDTAKITYIYLYAGNSTNVNMGLLAVDSLLKVPLAVVTSISGNTAIFSVGSYDTTTAKVGNFTKGTFGQSSSTLGEFNTATTNNLVVNGTLTATLPATDVPSTFTTNYHMVTTLIVPGNSTTLVSVATTFSGGTGNFTNGNVVTSQITTSTIGNLTVNTNITMTSMSTFIMNIDAIADAQGVDDYTIPATVVSIPDKYQAYGEGMAGVNVNGNRLAFPLRLPGQLYGKTLSITSAWINTYQANSGSTTLVSLQRNILSIGNGYFAQTILNSQSVVTCTGNTTGLDKVTIVNNTISLNPQETFFFLVQLYFAAKDDNRTSQIIVFGKTN